MQDAEPFPHNVHVLRTQALLFPVPVLRTLRMLERSGQRGRITLGRRIAAADDTIATFRADAAAERTHTAARA